MPLRTARAVAGFSQLRFRWLPTAPAERDRPQRGGNPETSKRKKKKKKKKQQLATDVFHLLVISGSYHFLQLFCNAKQFLLMRIFEVFKASGNFGLTIEVLLFSETLGPLILDEMIM